MILSDGDRLLRRAEVEQLTGLSCSSIYRLMSDGQFPRPKRIAPQAVRWLLSEIQRWIADAPRV